MSNCNDVLDDLAEIVAGDSSAIARNAEHLASCDECRDLRHEAETAAELAAGAGSDYVAPTDLAARVLAKIDEVPPAKIEVVEAKPAAIEKVEKKTVAKPAAKKSRAPMWAAAAAAAAAVIGGNALVKHHGDSTTTHEPSTNEPTKPVAMSKDQIGTIASVARASAKTDGGISVKTTGDWKALEKGDAIPAGATLKTDDRTRVSFTLTDGSLLTLDHDTEISFASADARQMKLAQGRLVADVTHDEKHHASITTPSGAVNILGTKLVVTATTAMTSVQTVRGEVSLTAASGAKGSVRAGEEGVMENGTVNVASSPSIASELAWTDLETQAKANADDLTSGLGSLKAYKPGEKRDRDWNMALAKHDVKIRISGPIARTEITETFRNDSDVTLEGRYQFPLPSDAQIDGLALDSKDAPNGFLDGAFVDKTRGQKIFQGVIDKATPVLVERPKNEIIWVPGRWRDPALLDWQRGGRFQLKIYPIPAHGSRTIKIAYTQVVGVHGSQRRYVYPLAHSTDGSTVADQMSVDVEVRGAEQGGVHAQTYTLAADPARANVNAMTMSASGFVPKGDLVIDYKAQDGDAELRAWTFVGNAGGGAAVAPDEKLAAKKNVGIDPKVVAEQKKIAGDARPTAVLALRPHLPRSAEAKPRDVMIVIDSSQSMVGERYTRASNLAVEMIGQMDRRDRFSISACDSECQTLGDMRAPTQLTAKEAKAFLAEQQVAGASDIVQSIRKASDFATEEGREKWVIFVGDGFASTGFRKAADVEHALASVTARGVSVTTVGIGGDADATVLAAAARGGGGSFLAWTPGESVNMVATTALDSINGAQLRDAKVELPEGLADIAPTILPTVRSGEEVLLAARMTADVNGKVVVTGMVGNEPFRQEYPVHLAVSGSAGNGFVPRLWASLAIAQLERRGEGDDRIQTIALSQGYGVMSKETSLLVLESEKMFDAFGVDRTQPTNKWTGEDSLDEVVADGALALDGNAPKDADAPVMATGAAADSMGFGKNGGGAPATVATKTPAPQASPPSPAPSKKAAEPAKPKMDSDKSELAKESTQKSKRQFAEGPVANEKQRPVDRRSASDDFSGDEGMIAQNMIPMRRIWVRIPSIAEFSGTSPAIQKAVTTAEDALAANPDSREKHRALVQALAYAGDIDRAKEVAAKWLDRDRLDPQALGYTADLLGRDGQRELALRTLAGLVDLDADSLPLHQRMIGAYEAAGRLSQACSHRIAVAAITPKDLNATGAAMRCLRAVGRDADAELLRKALPDDKARSTAEKAATVAGLDRKIAGDLVMNASWQGNVDLDISLVTPSGERVSWMGGRTDAAAKDASSNDREALSLRSLKKGNYLLEITRGTSSTGVIRGTVEINALGARRTLPFELTGPRSTVGRIAVNLQEQWVRVDDPRVNSQLIPVVPNNGGGRRPPTPPRRFNNLK